MTFRPHYNHALIIHDVLIASNPPSYEDMLDNIAIEIGQNIPPAERLQDIIALLPKNIPQCGVINGNLLDNSLNQDIISSVHLQHIDFG